MGSPMAVVAGCGGIVGYRLARHLSEDLGWKTIGLSRSRPAERPTFDHIGVDLSNPGDCRDRLSALDGVTHLFYCARAEHKPGTPEPIEGNLALLRNVLDVIEARSTSLAHVHLVHGTKYYGAPYGRYRTPSKESDPRHLQDCFYFAQQDYIEERQKGKRWTWSISRPQAVSDAAGHVSRSIPLGIAVYAWLCRINRSPLVFPATTAAYQAIYQCTDSLHLARAIAWISTREQCANEAFNVTNGDYFRWENFWPVFADYFGCPTGPQQKLRLQAVMPMHAARWEMFAREQSLSRPVLDGLVDWPYLDFALSPEHDRMSDVTKLRRYGFGDVIDSERMFIDFFDQYKAQKKIPSD